MGLPGEGLAPESAFFPQVPSTVSFHPLISKPPPRRADQYAFSLSGVSRSLWGMRWGGIRSRWVAGLVWEQQHGQTPVGLWE